MAEDSQNPEEQPKKKLPMKTIIVLAAAFAIEAVAISAVWFVARAPSDASAHGPTIDIEAQAEMPTEFLVLKAQFQNRRQGRAFVYDTELYIVVKQKYLEQMEVDVEGMAAQIEADIATIFRKADPSHLGEATLATVKRQIRAVLDERLGRDEEGNSLVLGVAIPKCLQSPSDY